ncbi:MAG: metalloregulator ArsR/SmtB family transcription factor [Clostridia bacterium]|nr:metalloregulator ArsR/SmtB family transcription factor [Clostridia bacterium]
MDATLELLKALADQNRLAIAAMLYREECYVELLASRLNLTSATTCHHLKKMEEAGLVTCRRTQFYQMYSLNRDVLSLTLEAFLQADPDTRDADRKYRDEIIGSFFRSGRLTTIPAQRKKREVIFAHILRDLKPATPYTEKEINEVILACHEDYCLIRREMIACGLLRRDRDTYYVLR